MTKLSDLGPPLTGTRRGSPPDEYPVCHFYLCPRCGQPVDMRDLRQVIWHQKAEHERLEADA
ncbi:MAG: hypothetical protein EOS54_11070 [Mesorhizobium sp.]|uniref:hypothetical protein n=1 Tax=unclassified Mesorhizobium TaxID=325217 RepID=UPI000F74ED9D|nr:MULTISPECIES: hypothetical protein [unclassified Mesorhizobium]AZO47916.1 hypothetical protein EJ073_08850 [Mesorhizobium sp. M4B.F.Ca.ET.058.02.1.1]RUX45996.1 hypothetical protein EOA33_22505 [Mesorhizobium sp. M4A.F.Ca.ET.050.02.1.1]RVC45037.1 hypothetical protein EN781_11555 [Mesorhizobium sp. M4A.F.Ca.ET.090.04.2.1]RVC80170.1 hypothetical protein EN745_13770 [Mesorhizobium sp. M4A.F.Ca.ET.022.05.2.1]RVD43822.1 hypothetical protein EN742_04005 [Mesorhizobium sp. M4A.F.Ca.ET.020.02.1.1]